MIDKEEKKEEEINMNESFTDMFMKLVSRECENKGIIFTKKYKEFIQNEIDFHRKNREKRGK